MLAALAGVYLLAAYALPFIPVNNDYKDADGGIKVFVLSNGVHTDIVVPAKTEYKDWTLSFPKEGFDVKDSLHTFIAFGWGDKGFYLYTPEWSDLKASTAFKACFGLGGTAMHVTYRKERTAESECCEIFTITQEQYEKLIAFIETSFEKKENAFIKIKHPGYGSFDRFYEAKGRYSLFKTCNIWTNNGLKETGVKVGYWSPFADGLINSLKH
jgi:uncharacterized protein (TIGR02117 family)